MSLKSLIGLAAVAGLLAGPAGGCTCSEEPAGASGAGINPGPGPLPPTTEVEAVPGIPGASPRVGEAEEVMLFAGGSPRQIRRFEFPTFGASEFDVTLDLAEGQGDEIQRHAQLALGVRARIEKPLDRGAVRWSLEIIDATANETEGVAAAVVARARELAPGLVGARAAIENDRRGRWLSVEIQQGTPSGRRAMGALVEAIETMRGLSYTAALGEQAEWGQRETRRWRDIEVRQTVQYEITHLEDHEMDHSITLRRNAAGVAAPGQGTVVQLVAQGVGQATVRFDRVMPTGQLAIATTAMIAPGVAPGAADDKSADATATGGAPATKLADDDANQSATGQDKDATGENKGAIGENQSAIGEKKATGDENQSGGTEGDGAPSESAADGDKLILKSKMQIAITARDSAQ